MQRFNESLPAARRKGDPQADQRGRLFRGGAFCRCSVFVAVCTETAVLLRCLRWSVFALKRGVSLAAEGGARRTLSMPSTRHGAKWILNDKIEIKIISRIYVLLLFFCPVYAIICYITTLR